MSDSLRPHGLHGRQAFLTFFLFSTQLQRTVSALLLNGFVVNISNPKAIVFLLAVLPQFLDLSKSQWIQYLIMAATMVTIDLIVMAGYTGLASKVLRLLRSPKQQKYLNRGFAVMFSCAALLLSTVHQAA